MTEIRSRDRVRVRNKRSCFGSVVAVHRRRKARGEADARVEIEVALDGFGGMTWLYGAEQLEVIKLGEIS